ncbi:MAG: 4Fe-4S dicluster domain-containing protein [Myxococcales bacterium]|nr:4Fe-4S dicluster domain-containing protein [Myxococcales bacterium]
MTADQAPVDRHALGRRSFLKRIMTGAAAATTAAAGCGDLSLEQVLQRHYKELSPADKERVFARIKAQTKKRFRTDINLVDPAPIPDVTFAFAISLSVCNGNRACVHACVKENNQSRDPAMQYIKVIELNKGDLNLEKGDMYFEGQVPKKDKFYLPTQCNQCDNPPCVSVCPVGATWKEQDGIVVVDYDWCIGCRYCMAACPYEARRFNFTTPTLARHELNTNQGYLSNRVRPRGVVEKCHFCLHRTRQGAYPACAEACPTGARKFGNLADPTSDVAQIVKNKRVFVLKEELQTGPRVFYYFD